MEMIQPEFDLAKYMPLISQKLKDEIKRQIAIELSHDLGYSMKEKVDESKVLKIAETVPEKKKEKTSKHKPKSMFLHGRTHPTIQAASKFYDVPPHIFYRMKKNDMTDNEIEDELEEKSPKIKTILKRNDASGKQHYVLT